MTRPYNQNTKFTDKSEFGLSLLIRLKYKCMILGCIDVQNEEFCSLDSPAKILRRIAPQDDIALLTNILTKGDNLNTILQSEQSLTADEFCRNMAVVAEI